MARQLSHTFHLSRTSDLPAGMELPEESRGYEHAVRGLLV